MIVHVADLVARPPRPLDRQRDRADDLRAAGRHLDAVVGVAGGSVAVNRRVDVRAARPGAVLALDDHHPGALAQHEPVPASIEGTRGSRGRVVVRHRHDLHPREAEHHAGRDAGIGASRQQDVGFAGSNERRGVADRIGRARAAARQHVADPVQPERDRDLARHHADNRHRNRVRRHLPLTLAEKVGVLPLANVDATAATADDDAGLGFADPQAGVAPRLAGGDHAVQRGA